MRRILAASALLVLLVGCAGRAASSSSDTGIHGTVVLWPTCPVESLQSPCPDHPLAGVEVRILQDGSLVTTVRSGEDGRFAVGLQPGRYVLEAVVKPGGPGMSAKPVDATVSQGGFVDVTVTVDSGIR